MLKVERISVSFGGVQALTRLDLDVAEGERVAVLGPNGSGKTTLLNAISGLVPLTGGAIHLGGVTLSSLAPSRIAAAGIARTFQTVRLFQRMTVLDNVRPRVGEAARSGRAATDRAMALIAALGLSGREGELAGSLHHVEQRLVEFARALAQQPRVLLLDEPSSGLSAEEAAGLVAVVGRLTAPPMAVVLIEHNLAVARGVCERAVMLAEGRKVADGPIAEVLTDPRLKSIYLGFAAN